MEWQQYFEEVPNFRLERKKLPYLSDILLLSLGAVFIRQAERGLFTAASGIENKLPWLPDVVFQEDQSCTRKGNAPENMAALRKIEMRLT